MANKAYNGLDRKYRIACLVSHPVQYRSPLFKKLAKHPNIDLTVLYCSDEGLKSTKDVDFGVIFKWDIPLLEGYNYKFLKNYSFQKTVFKWPFGLINLGVINELTRKNYDFVIIISRQYITHMIAFFSARLNGVKILYLEETPLNQEIARPRWKLNIKKIWLWILFSMVDGFLAIGKENRKFYRFYNQNSSKIFFAPYSIDNDRFIKCNNMPDESRSGLKEKLRIGADKKVILFCGKLISKKRPMILLKAYEKLNIKNKSLIFVGDGKLKPELENYVRNNKIMDVHFAGFKNQSEIPEYYAVADVFVLPSGYGETWGLVVNEAMCFKLPIIVSCVAGCSSDLVKHGGNGFILKDESVEELCHYLTKSLADDIARKQMGEKSFDMINKWSFEEDVKGIVSAIESI